MARSSRTSLIGNIMQKLGRALSSNSSRGRRSGRTTTRTSSRRSRRSSRSSGKGLLRKLLG